VSKQSKLTPSGFAALYRDWWSVEDLPVDGAINGLMEKRGGALIDIDRESLTARMQDYFDRTIPWEVYKQRGGGLAEPGSRFDPKEARERIQSEERFSPANIRRYTFKPGDNRWCYYSATRSLWSDPSRALAREVRPDNWFLVVRRRNTITPEGAPFFLTRHLGDSDLMRGHAQFIPALLHDEDSRCCGINLNKRVMDYLRQIGMYDEFPPGDIRLSTHVYHHVLAVGYSAAYLNQTVKIQADDWPRVPFPAAEGDEHSSRDAREMLLHSAGLGAKVAALLDMDTPFVARDDDPTRVGLDMIAVLHPDDKSNPGLSYPVTAGWGRRTNDDATSEDERLERRKNKNPERRVSKAVKPGRGRLERRQYTNAERHALEGWGHAQGLHAGAVYAALGDDTYDIYLGHDHDTRWRNIPSRVLSLIIGGYSPVKKFLSYREESVLDRALTRSEVDLFAELVRRLAALRLLEPALDHSFGQLRDVPCAKLNAGHELY